MAATATISSKGQITLPRQARQALGTNVVEIEVVDGEVLLKPVKNVAGAMGKYARGAKGLAEIREQVWEEVVREKNR